ncbi:MAG: DUF1152 domain-containing protein, partial [Halobacteria archaeon]|nr:DUF1152 domain-containing protein [Halobacteria archaeon]
METLEDAFNCDKALVFGIGGSGDIVGSIPTARLLELHGLNVILGGVAWEPTPRDPKVGPRSLDEIQNIEMISETVGLATGETRTHDGVEFTESKVAAYYAENTALIDITRGAEGTIQGLDEACDEMEIDLVVGTDSGGDILAKGNEEGLRSPLA